METPEKDVIRRFYEIVNAGSPERFDEICSPDLKGHAGAGADLAELKNSVASFIAPFPDLTAQLRHLVQEGDLVSVWISYTATHQADFAGVPASGRAVKFAAWDLVRVRGREDRGDHPVLRPIHDLVPDRRATHRSAGMRGAWASTRCGPWPETRTAHNDLRRPHRQHRSRSAPASPTGPTPGPDPPPHRQGTR